MKITITEQSIRHRDHQISHRFWLVECVDNVGAWPEVFGSRDQVDAFVKGVKAGRALQQDYNIVVEEKKKDGGEF